MEDVWHGRTATKDVTAVLSLKNTYTIYVLRLLSLLTELLKK